MNCPRCGMTDCNDPDSKTCSDNCITRLQRELSAYQAETPEAPESYTHWIAGEPELCVKVCDYDALAKRCARLTVERDAALKDAERYRWLRGDNESEFGDPWCVTRKIPADMPHEPHALSYEELDAAIDTALAAGKEKAE